MSLKDPFSFRLSKVHISTFFRVRLRVKNQPWFVSDTMVSDIDYVINEMVVGGINCIGGSAEQDSILCKFGIKWKKYLSCKYNRLNSNLIYCYLTTYRFHMTCHFQLIFGPFILMRFGLIPMILGTV